MQRSGLLTSLAALLISLPGHAEESSELSGDDVSTQTDGVFLDLAIFEEGGSLSDAELDEKRARENIKVDQITLNDQDQNGDVSENVAIGNTNGDNLIDGNAFSDASGFMSTVQNTGNNVLIQNSTIINVAVETPAN